MSRMARAAAERRTWTRPARRVRARLSWMVLMALAEESTKVASAAPRESASIPMAPVPANRSSTRTPSTDVPRLENTPSRARSDTGRVPAGTGASRVPFAEPAMTLDPLTPLPGSRQNSPARRMGTHEELSRGSADSQESSSGAQGKRAKLPTERQGVRTVAGNARSFGSRGREQTVSAHVVQGSGESGLPA